MDLVVIEGPGKKDTIQKYLGKDYVVFPTKGHIRDLPEKDLAIDVENNFEPTYEIIKDKTKVVKDLKYYASKADNIYLATDPDREGEAISWHIANILNLDKNAQCRITYNEISKKAINEALKQPRSIDYNLVDAQQARRVLDRLVGYIISPLLWSSIAKNLSAGRVQSVALKLIVDREREITEFKPEEYWVINAELSNKTPQKFKANLYGYNGKKTTFKTKEKVDKLKEFLKDGEFIVTDVKKTESHSKAPAPFITSSMQQEAINKLNMNLSKVTSVAQKLYEGVNVDGEGKVALITYIRTDSTRVSDGAKFMAKEYIINHYGQEYAPKFFNKFKTNEDSQDAHEAIRPITLDRTPQELKDKISNDEYRLYKLIYERFLASQMSDALFDSTTAEIECKGFNFKATGKISKFLGYTILYKNESEVDKESKLPELNVGDVLTYHDLICEQKFTKPPARFTEASLIKQLEDNGIGRPATYAQIITTINNRHYVEKKEKTKYMVPTEIGYEVDDFLVKYFDKIMNVDFTAKFETKLDEIADGNMIWQAVIKEFYDSLMPQVENAKSQSKINFKNNVEPILTDILCEKCGKQMYLRTGKFGEFYSCSGYPDCKNVKPKIKVVSVCPKCKKHNVIERYSKNGNVFYGCQGYPDCDFISWDKPVDETCPKCGEFLIEKNLKNKTIIRCSKCKYIKKNEE